jgi:ribonuclease HII
MMLFISETKDLWKNQENILKEFNCNIAIGVDEVGRGCLAGPVVSAAVAFIKNYKYLKLFDSKSIKEEKRKTIYKEIFNELPCVGIGIVPSTKIDKINILNSTKISMRIAIDNCIKAMKRNLINNNSMILIDGNFTLPFSFGFGQLSIVKGDNKIASIAAASIVAKVIRDEIMSVYDKIYPQYFFSKNKGYGTKEHYEAIKNYGCTDFHRKSFNLYQSA